MVATTILVIGAVLVVLVLGSVYYLSSSKLIFPALNYTTIPHNNNIINVVGSSENENITITNQSGVEIVGNSDTVNIIFQTANATNVTITGNDNIVNLEKGRVNLDVVGNDNAVYNKNTTILSRQLTGSGNSVS